MARLLVVEDDPGLADALHRGLSAEGFAVALAADGLEALHQAAIEDYEAIVLDVKLPSVSGYEVLKRLRADEVWTPVLMLTAKDGEYDIADALDLGADDYLVKPFSFVVLVARLRALVRRGGQNGPVVLTVGDLALDPARRRFSRAGVEVSLTAREFAVMECLMSRGGEVISKREILRQVWDEHFDGDPNIVEVYVGYLRRKLDAPFGRNTIETIRGAGYRINLRD